ncbi:hypothetical protein DID74_00895 [Candidatus Marinamargulisbacteria bacterium SCGC AG-333-B06]|nr:hypothetical protein DID74_00895 [Candidatus Marinamargulisbacteria bacterium SCGC AG-333-B06]
MYTYFSMQSSIISKANLAKELAVHMGWTQKKSLLFIDDCFDWIKSQMLRGHRIVLSGFGVFQLNLRKKRRLLHPMTQKPLLVPERLRPNFTPSDAVLHLLNHRARL